MRKRSGSLLGLLGSLFGDLLGRLLGGGGFALRGGHYDDLYRYAFKFVIYIYYRVCHAV